jgi:Ca-activated chloride channel homolog
VARTANIRPAAVSLDQSARSRHPRASVEIEPETHSKPMSRLPRAILILAFIACLPQSAIRAQDDNPTAIHVRSNLVMLDATVKTKSGDVMDNLKKDDFEIREDGVKQKIDVFSRDELPLNVALVLDLSDSIEPFLGPLRDSATVVLQTLKPADEVALFTFSTDAQLLVPLTNDKSAISQQIGALKTGGSTNINDGIFLAAQTFLTTDPKGRRVIILISDDVGTNSGNEGTRDIVTECIAADTSLYNLKIPGYNPPPPPGYFRDMRGIVDIGQVAAATGGEIFNVPDVGQLSSVFSALIERIRTRYALGYYTSANGAMGKPHKLDVRLAPSFGTKGRDYVVLSKNSYYIGP